MPNENSARKFNVIPLAKHIDSYRHRYLLNKNSPVHHFVTFFPDVRWISYNSSVKKCILLKSEKAASQSYPCFRCRLENEIPQLPWLRKDGAGDRSAHPLQVATLPHPVTQYLWQTIAKRGCVQCYRHNRSMAFNGSLLFSRQLYVPYTIYYCRHQGEKRLLIVYLYTKRKSIYPRSKWVFSIFVPIRWPFF